MHNIADAIRKVTATMQDALDTGKRSARVDANDLINVLFAIADEIDPPMGDRSDGDRERPTPNDAGP